jgi:hypothetical protein
LGSPRDSVARSHDAAFGAHEHIQFGYFNGKTIFRNRLAHAAETLSSGFVSLRNLLPLGCTDAICTTFCCSEPAWLEDHFSCVDRLLVVRHDERPFKANNEFVALGRQVGDAELRPIRAGTSINSPWQWLIVAPHTGGLLHAKLLLLRAPSGLRVIVSGNNLMGQWDGQRDALWVQDFPCNGHVLSSVSAAAAAPEFEVRLRSFISRLTACKLAVDRANVEARLTAVLDGVDFSVANARLVDSFPTRQGEPKQVTGWKRLAEAAGEALRCCGVDAGRDSANVYGMAGSFGDLTPRFMQQMLQAMHGSAKILATSMDWENVGPFHALWPSCTTALGMDLHGLISSLRSIPPNVYSEYTTTDRHFFDAPPNPSHVQPGWGFSCVAHAKALLARASSHSVVYVGSHNLSKAAWAEANAQPKNIELGVVLASCDPQLRCQWVERLPCLLPDTKQTWTSARDRRYRPATVPTSIYNGLVVAEQLSTVNLAEAQARQVEVIRRLSDVLKRPWTWTVGDGNFIQIRDVADAIPGDTLVDCIGVVESVGEIRKVRIKKTKAEIEICEVLIADDSGKTIQLTLWDSSVGLVSKVDEGVSILAATNVGVSDYHGCHSLNVFASSHVAVNIDHPRAAELRRWRQTKGGKSCSGGGEPTRDSLRGSGNGYGGKVQTGYIEPSESACHLESSRDDPCGVAITLTDDELLSACL